MRLRAGEALAGIGGIALLGLLFTDWFGAKGTVAPVAGGLNTSGWTSLGWGLVVLLVVVIVLALVLVAATALAAPAAICVGSAVMAVSTAAPVAFVTLVRVVTQPGLGFGLDNAAVTVKAPAYLGLVALGAIVAGSWITLADERTDAAQSAYSPPPARPVPGGAGRIEGE